MAQGAEPGASALQAISNAMVRLHKDQFGRGPTNAHAYFAGPDAVMCVLEDALLPAERKMVELGNAGRVRDSRVAFQAATEDEFVSAVEEILGRKVHSFASGVDPSTSVVFENFYLHPRNGDGAASYRRASIPTPAASAGSSRHLQPPTAAAGAGP
jgi:uncharacterized protein YbcI